MILLTQMFIQKKEVQLVFLYMHFPHNYILKPFTKTIILSLKSRNNFNQADNSQYKISSLRKKKVQPVSEVHI